MVLHWWSGTICMIAIGAGHAIQQLRTLLNLRIAEGRGGGTSNLESATLTLEEMEAIAEGMRSSVERQWGEQTEKGLHE
jgi:hypothetical protein